MTDEEKAEAYVENLLLLCKNFDYGVSLYTEDVIKKAVLYGLAEGRKELEKLIEKMKCCENSTTTLNGEFISCCLQQENTELQEQIEKMKCCYNCKNYINKDCFKYSDCHKHDKWELQE